jgi:NitT/TauT family transport system substrate-binding protein
MRVIRRLSCVLAAVLVAVPAAAAPGKLTISTATWVGYGALYLARDLGYFKEGGLDVDLIQSDDTVSLGATLASGAISGAAGEVDYMLPIRKNVCIKGVVALDESAGADGILTTPDIDDLSKLKGKEIAASEPALPNIFLSFVLKKAGLSRSDVTILNMAPQDAAAAFIAGRVPVAVTFEPSLTFVQNNRKGLILVTSRDAPGLISDLVYLRCDVIASQPNDVRTLVKGLFKADAYIEDHQVEAYDIMRKYVGGFLGTEADFATAAKGVKYYDHDTTVKFLGTTAQPGTVMDTVKFIGEVWGPIIPKSDYSDLFDPSFID